MTAQIADILRIDEDEYSILAIQNVWPFDPKHLGLTPQGVCSACWRGHFEEYVLKNDDLVLDKFAINLDYLSSKKAPEVFGKSPGIIEGFKKGLANTFYEALNQKMDYSGGLLIGRKFLRDFYIHMGFHRPHCFEVVLELEFAGGRLKRTSDHSAKMEEIRKKILEAKAEGGAKESPNREEIGKWIDECFSLDYSTKKNW